MKITKDNYFEIINGIGVDYLPEHIREGHKFVVDATENNTNWTYYLGSSDIKKVIDTQFAHLSAYIQEQPVPAKPAASNPRVQELTAHDAAKELIRSYVLRGDSYESIKKGQGGVAGDRFRANIAGDKIEVHAVQGKKVNIKFPLRRIFNEILSEAGLPAKPAAIPKKISAARHNVPAKSSAAKPEPKIAEVERTNEEVRFIKRYVLMNGRIKTQQHILAFIKAVQKAILEKRIRKTSIYADEIGYIQDTLVSVYNRMGKEIQVSIKEDILKKFKAIADSEKIRLSVTYMKRYIGIQGRNLTKDKAKVLYNLVLKAVEKQKIHPNDPYKPRISALLASLKKFIGTAKNNQTLEIHEAVLSGLQGALSGLGCKEGCSCNSCGLGGFEMGYTQQKKTSNGVMNSVDFANLQFDSLGFTGKWLELIGDPSQGFTAMIFGKPKMGKSYLAVDFAGYLARTFGKVIYVAREEKLDATLQLKLNDKGVMHPNLFVSDYLPTNLSDYDFVFLDSVNKLQLSPQDLEQLKANHPGVTFIYIFQTTKEGKFRGANEFQHDVDVVIEVPEKGRAVQFGRYNQGGEIDIFGDDNYWRMAA